MKKLQFFLKTKIQKGLGLQLTASRVCVEFDKIIENDFGGDFKDKVRSLHFKKGILTIAVNGSVYAQEIHYKSHLIIEKINKVLGQNETKKILIRS